MLSTEMMGQSVLRRKGGAKNWRLKGHPHIGKWEP